MRIRKPRGLTTTQLMVATVVGVLGGIYIYNPLLLDIRKKGSLHNDNIKPVEGKASTKQSQILPSEQNTLAKFYAQMNASRAKQPAKIFPLMATGLGLSVICMLGYKFYVNPYLAKRNHKQSQMFADALWDMHHSQKSDGES